MLGSQMMLQVFISKREQVPLREDIPRCKMHSFPAFFFGHPSHSRVHGGVASR